MSEKERLVELLLESEPIKERDLDDGWEDIVPPVKIGQVVYYLLDGFIEPCTIEIIFLDNYTDQDGNCSCMAKIHFDREDCPYASTEIYFTDIGKTVFLTKEEAAKALKGGAE